MSAGSVSAPTQPAANDPDLYRIRDLIYRAAGIFQPDTKLRLVADRCDRRMHELGMKTLRDYLNRLTQPGEGRTETVKLLNEITVGETCFFRNQPQLDALKSIVWPRIISARASIPLKKLRIWSAGCHRRRSLHAGPSAAGRKRELVQGLDIRHSGNRPQRTFSGAR